VNKTDVMTRDYLKQGERESVPVILEIVRRQVEGHRFFVGFVPQGTPWCTEEELEELRSYCTEDEGAVLHLCAHGFKSERNGLPEKRPHLVYTNGSLPRSIRVCPGDGRHPRHSTRQGASDGCSLPEGLYRSLAKDFRDAYRVKKAEVRAHSPKRGQCEDDLSEDGSSADEEIYSTYQNVVNEDDEDECFCDLYPAVSCVRCKKRIAGLP
jgi:hypothetical protein